MKDITHKQVSLRKAAAAGKVFCSAETVQRIRGGKLDKGSVFEFARAAGFLGAKQTQHLLPHCHPVSIESISIDFSFLDEENGAESGILINAEASSIGRTGIEMEVLTAIAVAALEIYDFLKPHDKNLEIGAIRLLEKTGGKSDKRNAVADNPECAILVCSDTVAANNEVSGKLAQKILIAMGARPNRYEIVKDEIGSINDQILGWVAEDVPFIFTIGGTGLGPRDQTVEAVMEIIEKEAIGISEALRANGRIFTPTAILSRAIAGTRGRSLIITLPGNPAAIQESLDAILPAAFHARLMLQGKGH